MATDVPRNSEVAIAVFVDFENLAIGVRDMKGERFEIELVLKRLLEKGRIVFKRAYCDWSRYRDSMREFHTQGIELIDIPQTKVSGKNSADIRMVVDALDLCYSKEHIDIFALLSGDSDFSPLVVQAQGERQARDRLRREQLHVGPAVANCDEFIYYDDLIARIASGPAPGRSRRRTRSRPTRSTRSRPSWSPLSSRTTTRSGARWSSRRSAASIPASTRRYYGYRSFSDLLEDGQAGADRAGVRRARGNYKVRSKPR